MPLADFEALEKPKARFEGQDDKNCSLRDQKVGKDVYSNLTAKLKMEIPVQHRREMAGWYR